jgi:DNA repair protein RAD16
MHFSSFKSKISNPIIKYGYMGAGKVAFDTLRSELLAKTMLRRTKEERKADLKLPPMKVVIRRDKLSKQEKDFYSSLYMQSVVKFDTYVHGGTILHNYAHIFDLLTSLRRAVDHPYLIIHGGAADKHKLPVGKVLPKATNAICGLCQEDILEDGEEGPKRSAKCGHDFHDECIRDYIADAPKLKAGGVGCPVCFTKLHVELGDEGGDSDEDNEKTKAKGKRSSSATPDPKEKLCKATPVKGKATTALALPTSHAKAGMQPGGIMRKVKASEFQSSTKIEALVDETKKMMKQDPKAKAIVFSQYVAMLELCEFRLKQVGISCVVFRGGMTMQARQDALVAFNTEPSLKVILISLKAGGEGLNLQIANHVFLMDPWWNPACEMQAIQRAHRIGQTREVRAVRFITTDTIEDKIVQLQEKKRLVFEACIDDSKAAMTKLTEQDLKFLFQH